MLFTGQSNYMECCCLEISVIVTSNRLPHLWDCLSSILVTGFYPWKHRFKLLGRWIKWRKVSWRMPYGNAKTLLTTVAPLMPWSIPCAPPVAQVHWLRCHGGELFLSSLYSWVLDVSPKCLIKLCWIARWIPTRNFLTVRIFLGIWQIH